MYRLAALLFISPWIFSACETVDSSKPKHLSSTRGLESESGQFGNAVLVKKGDPTTLSQYNKVIVEKVKVSIPNSTEEAPRASRAEAQEFANRFEEILREELRPHYQITNRRGRDTMAVKVTLTDLQPSQPGVFVFNYLPYAAVVTTGFSLATGKTPGAGTNSFEAEVVDSYSRRQLYAIVDEFKGSKFQPGGLEKWGQTEAAMRIWSRKIRAGIQQDTLTKTGLRGQASKSSENKPSVGQGLKGMAAKGKASTVAHSATTAPKSAATTATNKTVAIPSSDSRVNLLSKARSAASAKTSSQADAPRTVRRHSTSHKRASSGVASKSRSAASVEKIEKVKKALYTPVKKG